MEIFTGIGVNGGIAIGRLSIYYRDAKDLEEYQVVDADLEINRFEEALAMTSDHLERLYQKAAAEVGEETAMIFEVHHMMITDPEYVRSVKDIIRTQLINAEAAVHRTAVSFSSVFEALEDEYMKARAADVKDASDRLLSSLRGENEKETRLSHPGILAADDLVPSETIQLDRNMILGFVTQQGSVNSHTAILARMMGIPAIVGAQIELKPEYEGKLSVIDGYEGKLYIEPDQETLNRLRLKKDEDTERRKRLELLKGKESITRSGRRINLYANIGSPEDVSSVISNDAEGIGLFRSEFLFLNSETYPTEDEQFQEYKAVIRSMDGKRVIIRTLDIGADKRIDYFDLEQEENPALGYRAIRICLDRKDLFITQLRAIYRASVFGKTAIMFPMIISVDEVRRIKQIMNEVKESLQSEKIPFAECEIGIMIETPAAVMISDLLAAEVDFFSIGTNDLTQYTLAIDRQNRKLEQFYDSHHPAVLRMIDLVIKAAHAQGKWVGICGELASDLSLTKTFLDMGVDELSVSPSKILELRDIIIHI